MCVYASITSNIKNTNLFSFKPSVFGELSGSKELQFSISEDVTSESVTLSLGGSQSLLLIFSRGMLWYKK